MHPSLIIGLYLAMAASCYKMAAWKYAIVTVLILWTFNKFEKQNFRKLLGLQFSKKELPFFLLIAVICALIVELTIQGLLEDRPITKFSSFSLSFWFLQPLFQSFNEEVMGRAFLLEWSSKKIPRQWVRSLIVATFLTLGHFLFCIVLFKTHLSPYAGASLFFVTLGLNLIYFRTGHILYTWAIHTGVNFSFFGGQYLSASGEPLHDADKFNLFLGAPVITLVSVVFFLAIWFISGREQR